MDAQSRAGGAGFPLARMAAVNRSSHISSRFVLLLAFGPLATVACGLANAQSSAPKLVSSVPGEQGKKLGGSPQAITTTTIAPTSGASTSDDSAWLLRTAASLVGVVVLIVGTAFVVKKVARQQGGLMASLGPGGRAPSGVLQVLGRYPIARGTSLVLLKLDRRVLLLCQSTGRRLGQGTSMSTLSEITDADEVASILVKSRDEEGESLAKKFESMLGSFGGKGTAATIEPKPALLPRPTNNLADMLRKGSKPPAATNPAAPTKPLTKAQAIAALESRLHALRAQSTKEKAA